MGFNNPELNRNREGWNKEREVSEPTDPDYADKIEQRFLQDILALSDAEQQLALQAFPRRRREEFAAQLEQMKKQNVR